MGARGISYCHTPVVRGPGQGGTGPGILTARVNRSGGGNKIEEKSAS